MGRLRRGAGRAQSRDSAVAGPALDQGRRLVRYFGREEKCTGDPARRIGNEFLFERLAQENIATLDRYQVKTIVTSCPHCFNTFRNEYPQFGGRFEVYHHSEYLAKLVREGKLSAAMPTDKKVTFHDPCYLGRHNGIYDAPRELVQIATVSAPIEMAQSRGRRFLLRGRGRNELCR